jgi:hypothetical protein
MRHTAIGDHGAGDLTEKWVIAALVALLALGATVRPVDSDTIWPDEGSKLGIHGILPGQILAYVQAAVDAGRPFGVVKAVDDLSYLARVKAISQNTLTVARLTSQHEGAALVSDADTNLAWYAGEIMDIIFDTIDQHPELAEVVDYWEPINEPLGGGVPTGAYVRLAQLMIHCMDLAEARGLRLALFSFSAGTPEWDDMTAIVETGVFARAKAGGHILALHEGVYGAVPVDKWYGSENHIPGAPVIPDTGALTGRYRYWYHLLEQRDQVIPLFISEFYAGGGYDADGNPGAIIARLAWYDRQLQRDSYTLGFAPFTLGPTEQWVGEDYAFVYRALFPNYAQYVDRPNFSYLPIAADNALNILASTPEDNEKDPVAWWTRFNRAFPRRAR